MRIGIDAHVLGKNIGGVERYVYYLVKLVPQLLADYEFVVFLTRDAYRSSDALGLTCLPPNVRLVPLSISDPLIQRTLVLPYLAWKYGLDAIHVQRIAPWTWGNCRIVLTVHDLTPLKYVDTYRGLRNALVRLFTRSSIQRASLIITPTQTIAREIQCFFSDCQAPIHAYYNGVDAKVFQDCQSMEKCEKTLKNLGVTLPYVFFSGAAESRKNLETAYRAINLLGDNAPTLVLAGSTRDLGYAHQLNVLASSLTIEGKILRLGFVTDEELTCLYQNAMAFLAPSLDEGFNMPPLEAMACGAPVICSDIPVHRELFNEAAIFFPATSADDLAMCIAKLANDVKQRTSAIGAGRLLALRYTWEGMADRMSNFYRGLLDKKLPPLK